MLVDALERSIDEVYAFPSDEIIVWHTQINSKIYNDKIPWEDNRHGAKEIYLFDFNNDVGVVFDVTLIDADMGTITWTSRVSIPDSEIDYANNDGGPVYTEVWSK